ncbi:MAG: alpha/beta fold hydrolase [Gemmatimonadota bacterium]
MAILLAAIVLLAAWFAWRPYQRARWRAAEARLAQRLPLGSDGVARGAEPIVAGEFPRAALLLHGFGDTPQSLAYLAQRLLDAGWSVSAPLLAGHGRTLQAFHASRATDWLRSARDAFDALAARHQTVVVCGQSMGAALAIDVAATRNVSALALLAPYVAMPLGVRLGAALWPLSQLVKPVLETLELGSIHDPEARAKSLGCGYTTPRLLAELGSVVRRATQQLRELRVATLIVHSREDNRVAAAHVQRAADSIVHPVKALHWMSGCGHVLTADYCKDAVATLVVDWFEQVNAARDAAATTR